MTASRIIKGDYLLKKFPGKGGWTYAEIPEIQPDLKAPFGWVKIKGFIDDFEINQYKLMPMGNGQLFLPVKAEIRKKINKYAGDIITIQIELDQSLLEVPKEILQCFEYEEKRVFEAFHGLTEGQKKAYLDWIYSAKKEDTKAKRIAEMMKELNII